MVGASETENWTAARIPPQAGRLAVVVGATGDLGHATALALAQAGADIVLAGHDEFEGFRVVNQIRPQATAALVRFEKLNPACLTSVSAFAAKMRAADRPVDLLINYCTGTIPLARQVTSDGFEMQLGANYLAHFALTAQLLPLLRRSRKPRVVEVGNLCDRSGAIPSIQFDDLQMERAYDPWKAYCQAMLATLLFAQELQRRSDLLNWGLTAVAAHPGNLRPRMTANGDSPTGPARRLRGSMAAPMDASPSHSAEEGALPALFAATAPDIRRGGSYGPGGPSETTGPAEQAGLGQNASGEEDALRLWEMTEQLIGIKWPAE